MRQTWDEWLANYVASKQEMERQARRYTQMRKRDQESQFSAALSPETKEKLLRVFGGDPSKLTEWQHKREEKGLDGSLKAAVVEFLGEQYVPAQYRDVKPRSPEYYEALEKWEKTQRDREVAQRQLSDRVAARKMLQDIYGQDYRSPGAREIKETLPPGSPEYITAKQKAQEAAKQQLAVQQSGGQSVTPNNPYPNRQAQREEFDRTFDQATQVPSSDTSQPAPQQKVIKTPELIKKMTQVHSES